jgi:hypothetical protein
LACKIGRDVDCTGDLAFVSVMGCASHGIHVLKHFLHLQRIYYSSRKIVQRVHSGYWHDPRVHRQFLEDFAQESKIQAWHDWYAVKPDTIRNFVPKRSQNEVVGTGGSLLKKYYENSLINCLQENFPEHEWKVWRWFFLLELLISADSLLSLEVFGKTNPIASNSWSG